MPSMLSDDERRIRDVVRFDSLLDTNQSIAPIVEVSEDFASSRICNPSLSIDAYFLAENDRADRKRRVTPATRSLNRSRAGEGLSLVGHLAEVHRKLMSQSAISHPESRVARQVVRSQFAELGLSRQCVPPISTVLAGHRDEYERGAMRVDDLCRLLGAAIDLSIPIAERLIADVSAIHKTWRSQVQPKPGTVLEVAVSHLVVMPVVSSKRLVELTGANKSNVFRALDELVEAGIIREASGRKKDRIWIADAVASCVSETLKRGARARFK